MVQIHLHYTVLQFLCDMSYDIVGKNLVLTIVIFLGNDIVKNIKCFLDNHTVIFMTTLQG